MLVTVIVRLNLSGHASTWPSACTDTVLCEAMIEGEGGRHEGELLRSFEVFLATKLFLEEHVHVGGSIFWVVVFLISAQCFHGNRSRIFLGVMATVSN